MALVPAGSFTRGSDTGPPDARPSQRVGLDHYYIDIHEISNSQFEQCRDALRREKKAVPRAAERKPRDQSEPVMGVSWSDAIAYSRWAGKELATEAQWEKAARGPEGFEFPWGNGVPLWHRLRRSGQIDPVGSFPADKSFYGVFDMAGNAREWCADWYSPTTYQDAARKGEARGGIQNPPGSAGPEADRSRVVRGGDAHWRVWPRGHAPQVDRPIDVGFRCVLTFRPDRKSGESNKAPGR
jgi:formylglycine-generating enzyme required for sulfatase activity